MKHAGVGSSARVHAWRVLSAVLSWAAGSDQVRSIESNGCLFANEKIGNRRKSTRSASGRASVRRQGDEVQSWALSPKSVELLRLEMMRGNAHPASPILSLRDATIVSLQFGLALRNQEVYGLRWSSFMLDGRVRIADVLSWDAIDELGKTEKATGRIADVPELLSADLADWRTLLAREGFPVCGAEFVIPGNLAGAHYGAIDEKTGACHMSKNQAQKWRPRCMTPALSAAASRNPAWALIADATPYSLRRGGISARLRGESAQSVADQCGTSLEMLSRHYQL
jgi:integrase